MVKIGKMTHVILKDGITVGHWLVVKLLIVKSYHIRVFVSEAE